MGTYGFYLDTLTKQFNAEMESISAMCNLEYGDEFEHALCRWLERILPDRFGIRRGYVANADGKKKRDDIIIYDRSLFPTLQLRGSYHRLEQVPIEAVCAYIEVKHTLQLDNEDGSSLKKALDQVSAVKRICNTRLPVQPGDIVRGLSGLNIGVESDHPKILNPMYTIIFSRYAGSKSDRINETEKIHSILNTFPFEHSVDAPDLIVAGSSNLVIPVVIKSAQELAYRSPFFIEGSRHVALMKPERAFGISIAMLLSALEFIHLGALPWNKMVSDGLNLPY